MESNQQEMELEIVNNQPNGERLDNQRQINTGDFPEKYKSDPVLVQTIKTKAQEKRKSIHGLTILNKELFVVIQECSEVDVYDSIKFSFSRPLNLKELIKPFDVVSCNRNKCLYINDYKGHDKSKEILRVDPNGKLIKNWSTGDEYGWGLSVTDESNVILTVLKKNKLNEYSPDGQLIHEINLSDAGIHEPLHAIKLTNGNFMVSHGYDGRRQNRVCVVDACGKLEKSFGKKAGSTTGQLNWPWNLVVDGNGFVMVADRRNGRVLLLNSDLELKKEILTIGNLGLHGIQRILMDESNGRLFVIVSLSYKEERILIFEFR